MKLKIACRLRIIGLLCAFMIVPVAFVHGEDFTDFYPMAENRTNYPPKITDLSVICSKSRFLLPRISFIGDASKKVVLVVFTAKPIKDLSKTILLERMFTKGVPPSPTAGANLDWAYVFDRNSDGHVDYLTYLYGALPVKPDNFPEDYPKAKDGFIEIDSFDQIKLFIDESRLVFSHYADDNYDGSTDSVVASIHDPERLIWVDGFGVIRSTMFDGVIDETWTFRKSINERTGNVAEVDGRYVLQNDQPKPYWKTGSEWLSFGTKTMKVINQKAIDCGLGEGDFFQN